MTVGERIKMLREKKHMTLEEVAKKIGTGRATVYKYENGAITNIPPERIEALALLFEVSKPFLMGWVDDEMDDQLPLSIPVTDNEMFTKAYMVMSYDDRVKLTDIFNRAYNKLKEIENDGSR